VTYAAVLFKHRHAASITLRQDIEGGVAIVTAPLLLGAYSASFDGC
jgi:hypothetical protein